ncbi:DUF308 domain-containing protein, partial [Bradyrhizobium sp.]|uniref:DUF308 domain-containing protein n=1 Tax=Bradyrhizobium sp. TaxID=376 RepID=UPI003C5B2CDF
LVAIGFGIPINEFGLGNTLILAGAVTACSGLVILSLSVIARELKGIAERIGGVPASGMRRDASQPAALPRNAGAEGGSPAFDADAAAGEPSGGPPPPWAEETAARDRPRQDASSEPAPEPPAKPRRNLMFSSTSRRERERTQARTGDVPVAEPRPAAGPPPLAEIDEVPPANFDDAWPKSERARPADAPPQRRVARSPSTFTDPAASRQPPAVEDQPPVTVLKSGVVDGMAYSLYSDGSIEAQMPEGMMRFASIDELRAHLDQRS